MAIGLLSESHIAVLLAIYTSRSKKLKRKGKKHVHVQKIKRNLSQKYKKGVKKYIKYLMNLNYVQRVRSETYCLTIDGLKLVKNFIQRFPDGLDTFCNKKFTVIAVEGGTIVVPPLNYKFIILTIVLSIKPIQLQYYLRKCFSINIHFPQMNNKIF